MRFMQCFFIAALLIPAGCASLPEPPAVRPFSVLRYMGMWHEAARMPHVFEHGMNRVTAEYRLLPDGTVHVCNRGIRNGKPCSVTGIARQKIPDAGELEVSFFRPFYGAYRIVALDRDYRAALVISGGKKSAWILVRNPALARKFLPEYTDLLRQWGFDVSRLEYPEIFP